MQKLILLALGLFFGLAIAAGVGYYLYRSRRISMKRLMLLALGGLFGLAAIGGAGYFYYLYQKGRIYLPRTDYENPAVFQLGQVKGHAPGVPFASLEAALANQREECPYWLSLDGAWRFHWVDRPDKRPRDFHTPGFDASGWGEIAVPSNWEMHGHGYPTYRNIGMEFPEKPPRVPSYYNPVGSYLRIVQIPDGWAEREIFLRFEGVKSAAYIWVNGTQVGYAQGSSAPSEFNVTPFVQPGQNTIAVQVFQYSDGSFLENIDTWRLSGIFREVSLIATPKIHLRDYYVTTDLDERYQDAELRVWLDVANYDHIQRHGHRVRLELLAPDGSLVLDSALVQAIPSIPAGASDSLFFSARVSNPLKWSAETPHLYRLAISLLDEQGETLEARAPRIGFKKMEIIGNAIHLNGAPIKLNGVNSHMHDPKTGRAVSIETMARDFELMKQFNINLVRTSHYPPPPGFLDLADQYGMYVVGEAEIECHKYPELADDPRWKPAMLDRVSKMVLRDRNHPSILFWSAGNESHNGRNLAAVIEEGKRLDPARPFWIYGGNVFMVPFEDIVGPRYWEPFQVQMLAEQPLEEDARPSFMDEYLCNAGNGLGGLDEYWDLIYRYPRLSGGAIWEWVNQGLEMPVRLLTDASPTATSCAIIGKAYLVDGKEGNALYLSGHDEWVEAYPHQRLDQPQQFTLSFWVKPGAFFHSNPFIAKGGDQFGITQSARHLEFYLTTETVEMRGPVDEYRPIVSLAQRTRQQSIITAKLPRDWYDGWHQVIATYDGQEIALYIDGKEKGSAACYGKVIRDVSPIHLGRRAMVQDGQYSGLLAHAALDGLRMFDRYLSPQELDDTEEEELKKQSILWLDFEEVNQKGAYYSMGLGGLTCGMVWADRSLQPEIWQVKKSAQPVKVEPVNLAKGLVRVINRHSFTNLNAYECRWQIHDSRGVLRSGNLVLDLPPLQEKVVSLPVPAIAPSPGEEYHLLLSFHLPEGQPWAKAGHEVAWDQLLLPIALPIAPPPPIARQQKLDWEESLEGIVVRGGDFHYEFDKSTGLLQTMRISGLDILSQGPQMNCWRAPTANDSDFWAPWMAGIAYGGEQPWSHAVNWRSYGLDRLHHQLDSIQIERVDEGRIRVNVQTTVRSPDRLAVYETVYRYLISGDGEIELETKVSSNGRQPEWLPKMGLQWHLPKQFDQLSWYGRGPFETYPDRKTGARVGTYSGAVAAQYVPYLIPQDNGNKTDVRWLSLQNAQGAGLSISFPEPMNFSVHPFTTENMDRAAYPFQLQEAGFLTLNTDYQVSGVGDTARGTLKKYRTLPGEYQFKLRIKPLRG